VALMKSDLAVDIEVAPPFRVLQSGRWWCNHRCQAMAQLVPVYSRPMMINRRRLIAAAR
jgi:hypothetical protein